METITYKSVEYNKDKLDLKFNIYRSVKKLRGVILYFHGGGLLYGSRDDLPEVHKEKLLSSGYTIVSFDYRLAPETKFKEILSDAQDGVNFFLENRKDLKLANCPYFLWGRSAGAYLALLIYTMKFKIKPNAVISFYGYGFTVDSWFSSPSNFYLKYPKLKEKSIQHLIANYPIAEGDIKKRFIVYLYARQTGKWLSMLTDENLLSFLEKYSLKEITGDLPPAFFAYSFKDTDVPFKESIELQKVFKNHSSFTTSLEGHDFDRDEKSPETIKLLDKTIEFLNDNLQIIN